MQHLWIHSSVIVHREGITLGFIVGITPSNFYTFAFHKSNSLVSEQCGMILLSFAVSTESSSLGLFTNLAFSISSTVRTQL